LFKATKKYSWFCLKVRLTGFYFPVGVTPHKKEKPLKTAKKGGCVAVENGKNKSHKMWL